jgi:hypothetical protein
MYRNGQLRTAISYATLSAIIGFCMAYWSAAGNILTRLNVTPTPLTSVSDVANRMHKADRLSGISFEERWNAAPTPSTGTRDEQSQRETSWAETHIEKIPFSCELAFSRLVKTGTLVRAVLQRQTLLENWLPPCPRGYQNEVGQKPSSSRPVSALRCDRAFSDRNGLAFPDCSAPSTWLQ